MSSFRIRPRFKEELSQTVDEFKEVLSSAIEQTDEFTGLISDNYCVIKIPTQDRHYWSPQLTISLEDHFEEDQKITIRGLYGPKPSVWAIFFMGYAALGVLALFAGVFGLSQIMLEKPAPILWSIPVMAGIALVLYLIAQGGQKVGAEQMFRIHHFYEELMKHKIHIG